MAVTPSLSQLTLIHGDDRFLVDRSVREWRDRARAPQVDVEVFDAPGRLTEFRHAVAEMPLFDPERALLLRDPPQLTGSAKRGGADPPDRLVAILGELAPTTVLCLVAHAKVPDRNAVLAAVRARGGTIVFHAAVKGRDLRSWVEREIGIRGLRLGSGSVDHLIRVAGPDLGSIASELDKLVALSAGEPLSLKDVRTAVAGDEAAGLYETLGDLLGPTPAKGAESMDRLLGEGRAGQYLLAILAGQIRDLLLAQAYVQTHGSSAGLAAALGKPDWQADRLSRQARGVSPAIAAGWLAALHDVDRKLKTGEIAEADGLRLAVLRAAAEVTAERGKRGR
ncbi:MAG TPA: DNA polymerase III subunit delta [Candidatus Saccharimonadales bacterium]|nr:DNA polymerase III subunit delta [Candidatus Saccharimonadales bacterium]